jgi:hypothetical protein
MNDQSSERERLTAGELRRRLAEIGNPWVVDPRLQDNEAIPDYPTGGQLEEHPPPPSNEADVRQRLRGHVPTNPLMRAHWREVSLLEEGE